MLRRAVLVTEAWPGQPADAVLPTLTPERKRELVDAIHACVDTWHARGFRDRNLDLRNLLVRPSGQGWDVAKIDSPRWRHVGHGRDDRLAREDRARLEADLARFD